MKGYDVATVGKRKTAVARVYMKRAEGETNIEVNGLPYKEYFGRGVLQMVVRQPLETVSKMEGLVIRVNVLGGGKAGQAAAVRHGISRALIKLEPGDRKAGKVEGFLTRDARKVERKKYGHHKARKRPQFSKR